MTPWSVAVTKTRFGLWRVSAWRSNPDDWAMMPDRYATHAEAQAAADRWSPRSAPYVPAAEAAPEQAAQPKPSPAPQPKTKPQPKQHKAAQLGLFGAAI